MSVHTLVSKAFVEALSLGPSSLFSLAQSFCVRCNVDSNTRTHATANTQSAYSGTSTSATPSARIATVGAGGGD